MKPIEVREPTAKSDSPRPYEEERAMAVIIDTLAAHPAALDAVKRALLRHRDQERRT